MVKRVARRGAGQASFPDAPSDGCDYARNDGSWNRLRKESITGFVLDTTLPTGQREILLPGTSDPEISVNIVHIDIAKLPLSINVGTALSLNATNGSLNVLEDVDAIQSAAFCRASYSSLDNVVVGIGVGDPNNLPSLPGQQTGSTFVSNFVEARRGEGTIPRRQVTFQLPYFPVGKTGSNPALAGDQIFLCAWTEENDDANVRFDHIIASFRTFN